MRRSVLVLIIIVIILAAVAVFYFSNMASASSFSNENISFDYPNSFNLTKTPVTDESSTGFFVCALSSPSHNSAIVIYQIPLITTKNVTTNQTERNITINTTTNNSTNTTTVINQTIMVNVDNLQVYLDGVIFRGGTTQTSTKNNYTLYESTGLKSALVSYNSSSRTGNVTIVNVQETAIVKAGFANFYVIELINGDQDSTNAFNQMVNSFRIKG